MNLAMKCIRLSIACCIRGHARARNTTKVSPKIDNLAETAKTFDKMVTARKMKQIVPEY